MGCGGGCPDTGASDYRLNEVLLSIDVTGANPDPQLEVWSDVGGSPGTPLFEFDDPAVFVGEKDFVFTAGSAFTLQANTTYWLYLRAVPANGETFLWEATEPDTLPIGPGAVAVG